MSSSQLNLDAFTVKWLGVKDTKNAEKSFNKSLEFVKGPFKVWSEFNDGTGAVNFLPGAAAYLQTVLFGYAGFRIKPQQLVFDPVLPPGVSRFVIRSVDYLELSWTFNFDVNLTVITVFPKDRDQKSFVVFDLVSSEAHHFNKDGVVRLKGCTKGAVRQVFSNVKQQSG